MRLSNRDLLLLAGIVVAVIVTLTTLVYSDHIFAKEKDLPRKSTSLLPSANKLIEFVVRHTHKVSR